VSIKLSHIDVGLGESIFVQNQGSSEESILVQVSEDGRCFISGPSNQNSTMFELTIEGMKEIEPSEAHKVLNP
jgi:hypothetical protein